MTDASGTPRRRGRPPRHDRTELLDIAAEELLEHGYHALTHASLARRAGIPTTSVQHHFPTAPELRNDALDHRARLELEELLDHLDAVPAAWDKVTLVIRDSISDEPTRQRTGWTLWLEYYSAAAYDTAIASRVQQTRTSWRSMLAEIIEQGQQNGMLRTSRSAQDCASILFALIDGFGVRLTAPGPADDTTHIVTTIETVAAQLLQPTN